MAITGSPPPLRGWEGSVRGLCSGAALSLRHRPPEPVAVNFAAATTGAGRGACSRRHRCGRAGRVAGAGPRCTACVAGGGAARPCCPVLPCRQCRKPACSPRAGSATRSPTTPGTRTAARSRPFRKPLCRHLIPKSVSLGDRRTPGPRNCPWGAGSVPTAHGDTAAAGHCGSCTAVPLHVRLLEDGDRVAHAA